jgi:hypothetical protein
MDTPEGMLLRNMGPMVVRTDTKASELARASSHKEISAFLDRAATFLGGQQPLVRLSGVGPLDSMLSRVRSCDSSYERRSSHHPSTRALSSLSLRP